MNPGKRQAAAAPRVRTTTIKTPAERTAATLDFVFKHVLPLTVVAVFFAMFRILPSNIADIDAYYHIRMSQIIREHGIIHTFEWLPYTIFYKPYVDMHFLYHLLNVPFTYLNLITAAKVVGAMWAIIAYICFHVLLTRLRVPFAGLWTLGLLSASYIFIWRMNISRVPAPSVAIQMLALIALYERRYRMLAVLSFLFVWLYQLFVLMIPLAVIFTMMEYFDTKKINWRYLAYTSAGLAAGLVINPYFPHVFKFFYQHVFLAGLNPAGLNQGREWYPFDSNIFVRCCWGAFAALALVGFFGLSSGVKISRQSQAALLMCGMFLLAYVRSRRFIEYFVPYALLASSLVWRDMFNAGVFKLWPVHFRTAGVVAVIAAIAGGGAYDWYKGITELRSKISPTRYEGASNYIAEHSQLGDIVFTTDWDDFPELFYHNTKNRYVLGLDPNLLYIVDASKYKNWQAISSGQFVRPAATLARQFDAKYVLADYAHRAFIQQATKDLGLALCYQDSGSLVWRVDPTTRQRVRVEAENLTPLAAAQPASLQWKIQNFTQMFGGPSSGDRTLLVQTNAVGDYAEFAVPAIRDGIYDVKIGYVTAADMATVQWSVNGAPCGEPVDAYSSNQRAAGLLEPGKLHLRQGENRFRAAITGANKKARGHRLGVDYFQLTSEDEPTSGVPG